VVNGQIAYGKNITVSKSPLSINLPKFATTQGGRHVTYVTEMVSSRIMIHFKKQNKKKKRENKNCLQVDTW
jgi:hypothetical protein